MRIVALSDLHGFLPKVPDGNLCIIAGDICPVVDHGISRQQKWLDNEFRHWLTTIDMPIVAVWGNHDFIGEQSPHLVPNLKWHLLHDSSVEINGLTIWGSPYQRRFFDWAFNLDEPDLDKKWEAIPKNVDILVTHSPVYGYGDLTPDFITVGSVSLLSKIVEIKPKLCVYGHIHSGRGQWKLNDTILANVTVVNEEYEQVYEPMVFEI